MLGRATLEFNSPAVDNHGPNQIPVFQSPQGRKAGLADVLAQLPVTSGKNKGALQDAAGGALGGRQGRFLTLNHASRYIAPGGKKMETGKSKFETRKSKLENRN
jgi:hypothetical protein